MRRRSWPARSWLISLLGMGKGGGWGEEGGGARSYVVLILYVRDMQTRVKSVTSLSWRAGSGTTDAAASHGRIYVNQWLRRTAWLTQSFRVWQLRRVCRDVRFTATDRNEQVQKIFIFLHGNWLCATQCSLFSGRRAERLAFPDSDKAATQFSYSVSHYRVTDGSHWLSDWLNWLLSSRRTVRRLLQERSDQSSSKRKKQTKNYILFVYII